MDDDDDWIISQVPLDDLKPKVPIVFKVPAAPVGTFETADQKRLKAMTKSIEYLQRALKNKTDEAKRYKDDLEVEKKESRQKDTKIIDSTYAANKARDELHQYNSQQLKWGPSISDVQGENATLRRERDALAAELAEREKELVREKTRRSTSVHTTVEPETGWDVHKFSKIYVKINLGQPYRFQLPQKAFVGMEATSDLPQIQNTIKIELALQKLRVGRVRRPFLTELCEIVCVNLGFIEAFVKKLKKIEPAMRRSPAYKRKLLLKIAQTARERGLMDLKSQGLRNLNIAPAVDLQAFEAASYLFLSRQFSHHILSDTKFFHRLFVIILRLLKAIRSSVSKI